MTFPKIESPYGDVNTVYEDNFIAAFSKPHGLHVINDRNRNEQVTLKSLLTAQYGKIYVVHRLDAGTGGIIVFAKTAETHATLCGSFERSEVRKEYRAVVAGAFNCPVSVLLPISPKPNKGKYKINFKSGKTAVTTFYDPENFGAGSLVKVIPLTGRTHQIRVHLKALKHPLYKDWLYNSSDNKKRCTDKRLTLFAKKLTFSHPVTRKEIIIEAELSEFMMETLRNL